VTAALLFVTAGSAYPALMSVFFDSTVAVESRFFVLTVLPIAVLAAISLYMAFEGHLPAFALVTALAAVAGLLVAGPSVGVALLSPAVASLVLLGISLVKRRPAGRALVSRLAHLGMALFLVGVAGSSLGGDFNGSMRPGESVEVAGHVVSLVSVDTGETERYVFVRADFTVDTLDTSPTISPEIRAYEDQSLPVAEPVLRSSLVDDVIVAISLLFPDGETVEVSVFVRPLVTWVWAGAALMGVAALIALFWRGGAVAGRRPPATAGQRRGGTTSENIAR
jgi:cytochrome c-type biogenesis protein CcmF